MRYPNCPDCGHNTSGSAGACTAIVPVPGGDPAYCGCHCGGPTRADIAALLGVVGPPVEPVIWIADEPEAPR